MVSIDKSADGRANAYHVQCPLMGHCRPYAACLRLVEQRQAGKGSLLYSSCMTAIDNRVCVAVSMREEEKLKGEAIYFIEREGIGSTPPAKHSRAETKAAPASMPRVESKPIDKPARKNKSALIDRISTEDYASAINAAVKSELETKMVESVPTEPTRTKTPAISAKPGESLLAMARRLKGVV